MKYHNVCPFALFALVSFVFSCTSNEIGYSKDVNPETVYLYYTVSYDDGDDSVGCFLQYRFAGENGTTLILNSPAGVSIDGIAIAADSSTVSGAYYQKNFAAKDFAGKHVIVYTDMNGKVHKEPFSFDPVVCTTALPEVIDRSDVSFEFAGSLTDDEAVIRISDTSLQTEDVRVISKLTRGKITVTAEELKPLVNGPLTVEISKSIEQPFQHPTQEGGIFVLMYGIKEMETQLKD